MIEPGIFAKTFLAENLEGILDKVKEFDFKHIQFNMQCAGLNALPESIPNELARQIGQAIEKRNLNMVAVSGTFNMIHPDTIQREAGLKSFEQIAPACKAMQTNMISLCTGSRNAEDKWSWHPDNANADAWNDLLSMMERALLIAERYDLFLGVEPEMANVVRTPELALQLIQELQTNRIKIILDPANLFEVASVDEIKGKIDKAIDLLIEHITIVHAKDRSCDGQFRAAGKGDIDFAYFFGQLQKAGYMGPAILHGLREEEVPGSLAYLNESLTLK